MAHYGHSSIVVFICEKSGGCHAVDIERRAIERGAAKVRANHNLRAIHPKCSRGCTSGHRERCDKIIDPVRRLGEGLLYYSASDGTSSSIQHRECWSSGARVCYLALIR